MANCVIYLFIYLFIYFLYNPCIVELQYTTACVYAGYSVNDLGNIKFDKFLYDPTTASNVRRPRAVGAANKKVFNRFCDSNGNHMKPLK